MGEIRSLLNAPMLALTATIRPKTRARLTKFLGMTSCVHLLLSPDRHNVRLCARSIGSNASIDQTLKPIVDELKEKESHAPRIIIYCRSITLCAAIFATMHEALGSMTYWPEGSEKNSANRLVNMFHSATHEENKKTVLESLATESGTCRVVISTSALGMGINMKGVRTVVHYGPPDTA